MIYVCIRMEHPFSWNNKFMLEFDYSRELKKESVIDASLKEFKLQPNVTDKDIKAWEVYLEQVIQPVQKGTKASVMWVPEGQIVFNYEGSSPSTIENENFARAFLNIWLGEKTSSKKEDFSVILDRLFSKRTHQMIEK